MDIVVENLTKRYRSTVAVDDLSFTARSGRVTGFLGPNGAGKSTTLRVLLGLSFPTSGTATIGGSSHRAFVDSGGSVGALLDTSVGPAGRRLRTHLEISAMAAGVDDWRVDRMLAEVDLASVGGRRLGALSLGMRQRLGLAVALIGDPRVLVLDEPFNGLDPAGVHWLRDLLRRLASEGTSVLLSSHLLSEVSLVADDVVMIAGGRLVAAGQIDEFGEFNDFEATFLSLTDTRRFEDAASHPR